MTNNYSKTNTNNSNNTNTNKFSSESKENETLNEVIQENITGINEENKLIDDTPTNKESPTLDRTCEELHKGVKVNIGNTIEYTNKKKSKTWLKVLICFVIIVATLLFVGLKLIYNPSEYLDKYDDITTLKEEIEKQDCPKSNSTCTLQDKAISNVFDNMELNDGIATIKVSKGVIYAYCDLDTINNIDYLKNNDIVIKQIGYEISDENIINIYADLTYKKIKATIEAKLTYEFDNNDNLIIKFKDAEIGDLPKFIYKSKLPKEGEILYQKNISYSINAADDVSIKIFSPSTIKDIKYDEKTGDIIIEFAYANAINDVLDDLFNTDNGSSKFSDILSYYLTGQSEEFNKIIDDTKDYVNDNFGIDIDALLDIFK